MPGAPLSQKMLLGWVGCRWKPRVEDSLSLHRCIALSSEHLDRADVCLILPHRTATRLTMKAYSAPLGVGVGEVG
jgi:hypothetical protein